MYESYNSMTPILQRSPSTSPDIKETTTQRGAPVSSAQAVCWTFAYNGPGLRKSSGSLYGVGSEVEKSDSGIEIRIWQCLDQEFFLNRHMLGANNFSIVKCLWAVLLTHGV
jgi:hypothetical protein